jgi:hypothetical protein
MELYMVSLEAQLAGDETLARYPSGNVLARKLAIMDVFHLIAALKYLGPISSTLHAIPLDCVGVEINL